MPVKLLVLHEFAQAFVISTSDRSTRETSASMLRLTTGWSDDIIGHRIMKLSKKALWMLAIAAIAVIGGWYYFAPSSSDANCHCQGHRRADRAVGHGDRHRQSGHYSSARHLRVGPDHRHI